MLLDIQTQNKNTFPSVRGVTQIRNYLLCCMLIKVLFYWVTVASKTKMYFRLAVKLVIFRNLNILSIYNESKTWTHAKTQRHKHWPEKRLVKNRFSNISIKHLRTTSIYTKFFSINFYNLGVLFSGDYLAVGSSMAIEGAQSMTFLLRILVVEEQRVIIYCH